VYRAVRGDVDSTEPAWPLASSPQPRACPTATTSKIGPGRWTYLTDWNPAHAITAILGDSLPDGSYALTAVVRAGAELIYVPAGTHMLVRENQPPLTDPELLEYNTGKSINDVAPSYLSVRIYARNPLSRSVHVEFGACSVKLWLYRKADLSGEPVWRSERRSGPNPDILYGCPAYLASKTFLPNEVASPAEFGIVVPMHEILADSLPNGRYYVLAEMRFQEGSGQTLTHPQVRFNAGEVELRKDTTPIPRARMLDGVRYELGSALEGNAVRLTFTVTNTTSESRFVGESPSVNCAGSLWGYLNAGHRDFFYLTEPQPDWRALACAMVIPATVLAPGATATFSTLVPVGATSHRGRDIHLIAAVWLADQQPGDGLQRLILSAGQVRVP
jgi:hypothetical protein